MRNGDEVLPTLTNRHGETPRVMLAGGSRAQAVIPTVLASLFGCRVDHVPTGEDALSLLREAASFDLAALDLALPDMEARVAVQLIRTLEGRINLPILALAGFANWGAAGPANQAAAIDGAGFAGILETPYSPRQFHAVLAAALASKFNSTSSFYASDLREARNLPSAALNSAPKISATATT